MTFTQASPSGAGTLIVPWRWLMSTGSGASPAEVVTLSGTRHVVSSASSGSIRCSYTNRPWLAVTSRLSPERCEPTFNTG